MISTLEKSGNDCAEQVGWLERIIDAADAHGDDLWASPYSGMLKLKITFGVYYDVLQDHLPQWRSNQPKCTTRIVIADLVRLAENARKTGDLAQEWSATLLSCMLFIKDNDFRPETHLTSDLVSRCEKLFQRANAREFT